jgi:PAS domain S-box-containing protein
MLSGPRARLGGGCAVNTGVTDGKQGGVSLTESEERFHSLCAFSPVGIFLTDTEGRCTYTNPRYQSICGLRSEESPCEGWMLFIHPEGRREVFADWAAHAREGREYSREFRFRHPRGVARWVQVRTGPMFSEGGRLVGHVGTVEDITERQETEQALRESESKYRMLMEQASDGIHTYDLEGNFIEANSKLCAMLGYTREELLGLNVKHLIPEGDLATAPIRFDELRAGETIISERLVRRRDGTVLPVEISGRMLPNGVLQAIIRDITARREAEETLRSSEMFARATVDSLSANIAILDEAGRVVAVNAAWHEFATRNGACLKSVGVGVNYLEVCDAVIGQSDAKACADGIRAILDGTLDEFAYEYACHARHEQRWFVARVTRFPGDGPKRVVVAHENITERKLAEEALRQAHDELERRVAERTGELANANKALQAEISERKHAEEARRQLLGQVVTAQEDERRRISRELHDQMGQHIAAIVLLANSLKDVSQPETSASSKLKQLEEVARQLSQEVDTLAWELRPIALDDLGLNAALGNYVEKWSKRAHLPLDFHTTGLDNHRLPPHIETAIYRIVQEALTNIIKHARATYASLILERRGNQMSAIIEDNGCGFDVEALSAVRAEQRRMGFLGMQERATLVGGTLSIESTPGAGTTVYVRVPISLDENKGEGNLE